jgi:hypothetical protein
VQVADPAVAASADSLTPRQQPYIHKRRQDEGIGGT